MNPYYQDAWVTIYNADNNEVMAELPDAQVKLVITDPPYGISYRSNHRQQAFNFIAFDKTYPAEWLKGVQRVTDTSASFYIFCNDRSFDVARLALYETKFELNKTLIWDKMNVTSGNLDNYGDRCEFILFASKKYGPKLNGSRDGNIISIPRVNPLSLRHPTEKPEYLMSYLVMKSSDPKELILDPFMGVGPSILAAKKLGRRAIGIDIEERWCEIAAKDIMQASLFLEVGAT